MKPRWDQIRSELFNRYIRDNELPAECQSDPCEAPDAAAHEARITFLNGANTATDRALTQLQSEWTKKGTVKDWE